MENYKVLFVDDEEDVRRSIVNKLDWGGLGFSVAGEASNGEEALELAEILCPDVIMTDIKMPFMDGLELCRRAKALLPGVHLCIFSGFDEFEYAKEAIASSVEEYILKPIDAAELSRVFTRIHAALDQEMAQRRDVERLRRLYVESLPLMRQQVLMGWITGQLSPASLAETFAQYELPLAAEGYCAAQVRLGPGEGDEAAGQLVQLSLVQLIEDTLGEQTPHHLIQTPEGIALVFLLEGGQGAEWVSAQLGQLFPVAKKFLGAQLTIGVGGAYTAPEGAALSYRESCVATDYQILEEPGHCIVLGDLEPAAGEAYQPDSPETETLLRQIKVGSGEQLREAAEAFMRALRASHMSLQRYQIAMLELSTELMKLVRSFRLDPEAARVGELVGGDPLTRFSNLDQLASWLLDYCQNLRSLIRQGRKDNVRLLVENARQLLKEQYADPNLSLEAVCGQLGVSAAYFSTLFKRETGQGFVAYLTALRMEKALEILAAGDDKTYQIAEKVGYIDANYFSYVFKRKYGVSPSKYRQQQGLS